LLFHNSQILVAKKTKTVLFFPDISPTPNLTRNYLLEVSYFAPPVSPTEVLPITGALVG